MNLVNLAFSSATSNKPTFQVGFLLHERLKKNKIDVIAKAFLGAQPQNLENATWCRLTENLDIAEKQHLRAA